MSPHEAASMLGVPHTADADTVDAAIARLRIDYDGQIARAATPEMATYWRNSVARLDEARDVLRRAAEARAQAREREAAEREAAESSEATRQGEAPPGDGEARWREAAFPPVSRDVETDVRPGLPWESSLAPPFVRAAATVRRVLFDPRRAFTEMRRTGGLTAPFWFSVLVGVPSASVGGYAYFLLQVTLDPTGYNMTPREAALVGLFLMPLYVAVAYPVSLFLNAGLQHLSLLLLEKTTQPFETTFRAAAYAVGAASVLQLIPIVGLLASGVAQIVVTIIGLSRAHDIPAGRAALAYFLPVVACCGCFLVIVMAGTWLGSSLGR